MGTYTPNLNLYKPDPSDDYEDFLPEFNDNMDKLDNSGGGGGGISNFTETVLATASSFSDMTVDFSTAYDAFIFYTNDVTYQKSENYFFTRSEITDAINNNLVISMYPYGSGGYCQYRINRSGLTRVGNSSGFFIYKIVGLNFGSTPHIYSTSEHVIGTWIDGKPLYEKTINFYLTATSSNGTYWWCGNVDYTGLLPNDIEHGWFVNGYYETGGTHRNIMAGQIEPDGHNLLLFVNYSRNNVPAVATFQYTKTTD